MATAITTCSSERLATTRDHDSTELGAGTRSEAAPDRSDLLHVYAVAPSQTSSRICLATRPSGFTLQAYVHAHDRARRPRSMKPSDC